MNKRVAIAIALVIGLISIVAPIGISIYWAWNRSLDAQMQLGASLANEVIRRSDDASFQVRTILAALKTANASDPCSAENIGLMMKLSVRSGQVLAAGYIKNNTLLCSSYGHHLTVLGPPTFTALDGTEVRAAVSFPVLPDMKFLTLTQKGTGYSVAVHPRIVLDTFTDNPDVSVGLYSLSSKKQFFSRGLFDPQWMERLGAAQQIQFISGDSLVAIRRSDKFDFASYVTLPAAGVKQGLHQTALILVPVGVVAGVLLAMAVLYLARQQLALPAILRVALKREEFSLNYQPIVDLQTGEWVGAEALIRWRRQNGEMVRPDVFIPVAEETGLIQQITAQVMEMVGNDANQFFGDHPDFHIAINLSASDLESRKTIEGLTRLTRRTGAQHGNFLIEATERGFMNAGLVKEILRDIRAMGSSVAIDDFGTGYSSLSYLETFELDYLKIDKSFVDTLGKDSATSQVVPHIIEMAKSLRLAMIAEGVETEAQAQYLRDHGVQYAQGWLFARPMTFSQLTASLASRS